MEKTQKLRGVALLLPNLELGGAERQAVELALRLKRLGWRPVVIVAEMHGPLGERLRAGAVPLYDLKLEFWRKKNTLGFWKNLFSSIWRLSRIMRKHRVVVAQSFLFWQNVIMTPAAAITPGVKVVITGRRSMGAFKDNRLFYQPIENISNLLTDRIVCNSALVKQDSLKRESFAQGKISVIHNGVDTKRFWPPARESVALDLFNEIVLIGTVGNLKREKRHDIFLQAFALVAANFFGVHAMIVGKDLGQQQSLAALADKFYISDRIEFTGAMETDALLYHSFDVFVLTSDEEGMPNVLLEAMACGCAIVTTDVGGVRELIRHGVNGLIVPAGDAKGLAAAITRLLTDRTLRGRLGRKAAERARKHFSVGTMARRYASLYGMLADGVWPR